MKILLICENFRNRVKSCPLALFPYLILENHRDVARVEERGEEDGSKRAEQVEGASGGEAGGEGGGEGDG